MLIVVLPATFTSLSFCLGRTRLARQRLHPMGRFVSFFLGPGFRTLDLLESIQTYPQTHKGQLVILTVTWQAN